MCLTPLWITLRFHADDFPFRLCFFTMNVWVKEVPYVFSSLLGRTQIERLFKSPTNKDAFHLRDLKVNMDFNLVGWYRLNSRPFWFLSGVPAHWYTKWILSSYIIPLNNTAHQLTLRWIPTFVLRSQSPLNLHQFCLTRFQIEGWLEQIGTPSVGILYRWDCTGLCCLSCQLSNAPDAGRKPNCIIENCCQHHF